MPRMSPPPLNAGQRPPSGRPQAARPRPMPAMEPQRPAAKLPDRPSAWKLMLRRQRKQLKPSLLALMGLAVLIGAASLVQSIRFGGTVAGTATAGLGFDIRKIEVIGQQKTPQPQIEQALGARLGDPILSVSLEGARARIARIAWVRSAIIERVLPHTIRIVLDERRPFAVWQNHGDFTLIDEAGHVVSDADVAAFVDALPLVVGEGAPDKAAALMAVYGKYAPLSGRMLAAIRVSGRRWDLCMTSGAVVELPEGAEDQALAKLAELQGSKQLLDRPLAEIDLRLPDRLRLRPMTEAPCGHAAPGNAASGNAAATQDTPPSQPPPSARKPA